MTPAAIRQLIQNFLDLIEVGKESEDANEEALDRVLDELAFARHYAPPGKVTVDADAPTADIQRNHALAAARFPSYGPYGAMRLLDPEKPDELLVGTATDDIADIYGGLKEVAWTWDEVGEPDGLWMLHFGFNSHWGLDLRAVQTYIRLRHWEGLGEAGSSAF